MLDGINRVIQNHSGPRPAHHCSNTFLHLRPVTMDGALLTGRLLLPVTTMVKPSMCIIQQLLAARAERTISLLPPAIQTYHLLHHVLLFLNTSHRSIYLISCTFIALPPKRAAAHWLYRGHPPRHGKCLNPSAHPLACTTR